MRYVYGIILEKYNYTITIVNDNNVSLYVYHTVGDSAGTMYTAHDLEAYEIPLKRAEELIEEFENKKTIDHFRKEF